MTNLNSMQRVLTALSHQEADKVPFILTLTMHGAKELGLSIKEYFSRAENVFEGQKRLMQKYQSDAYYAFLHAPLEYAAWGGEVVFVDDGPPNSGEPVIRTKHDIHKLQIPDPKTDKHLGIALDVIRKLAVVAARTFDEGVAGE